MSNPFDAIDKLPAGRVTAPVTTPTTYDPALFPAQAPVKNELCPADDFQHTPLDAAPMLDGCPMFKAAAADGGVGVPQGVWMNQGLALTFCKDGQATFHEISKGYDKYQPAQTDEMWERKLAESAVTHKDGLRWPSCQSFEGFGAKQCATCPLKGKINSPLNLAIAPVLTSSAAQQAAPAHIPSPLVTVTPPGLNLPTGYDCVRNKDTGGWETVFYPDMSNKDEHERVFLNGILQVLPQRNLENQLMLCFEVTADGGATGWVYVTSADLGNRQLRKVLAEQNVICITPRDERLQALMGNWFNIWSNVKTFPRGVQCGWLRQENGGTMEGFAFGGKLHEPTGSSRTVGVRRGQHTSNYGVSGTEDHWRKIMNDVILYEKRPDIETIVAVGFAAPLMTFANLYQGVLYVWSQGSAKGKSTAIDTATAIWASPQRAKGKATSSVLGITHEIGLLRNLPFFLDECTEAGRIEQVLKLIPILTEGSDPYKQKSDGTPRARNDWQTTLTIAGNRSVWEMLRKEGHTDATLARVFEINVVPGPAHRFNRHDVLAMTRKLDHNYGHVGEMFARQIACNAPALEKYMLQYIKDLSTAIDSNPHVDDDKYRFWEALSGCILVAAEAANQFCHVGFHVNLMRDYLIQYNRKLRTAMQKNSIVAGSADATERAVNDFLTPNITYTAWTDIFPMRAGKTPRVKVEKIPNPEHQKFVKVRFAWKDQLMVIHKGYLDEFIKTRPEYSIDGTINGLITHYGARVEKLNINRGYGIFTGGPTDVIIVPIMPDSPWYDSMMAYQAPANDNSAAA